MSEHKWILLVEDNVHDVDLAKRALRTLPISVEIVVARDGVEAMDCLRRRHGYARAPQSQPAMVLMDLKMPRVDGLEVLENIKRDAHLRTIPVVIFTSSREESDLKRCYQLGANAYVVKPVHFKKYVATVKELGTFWTVVNELPSGSVGAGPGKSNSQTHFEGNASEITPLGEKLDSHLAA